MLGDVLLISDLHKEAAKSIYDYLSPEEFTKVTNEDRDKNGKENKDFEIPF